MAGPMNDAAFFRLVGIDIPGPNKLVVFKELVSLFDTLHDFGSFGSVYDYVTKSGEQHNTVKKTIFNHLRNGYSLLKGLTSISTTNSQLHCYSNNFHLKASLTKAKLETAFYNYARTNLISPANTKERNSDNHQKRQTESKLCENFYKIPKI